jgi:hypothetical protein
LNLRLISCVVDLYYKALHSPTSWCDIIFIIMYALFSRAPAWVIWMLLILSVFHFPSRMSFVSCKTSLNYHTEGLIAQVDVRSLFGPSAWQFKSGGWLTSRWNVSQVCVANEGTTYGDRYICKQRLLLSLRERCDGMNTFQKSPHELNQSKQDIHFRDTWVVHFLKHKEHESNRLRLLKERYSCVQRCFYLFLTSSATGCTNQELRKLLLFILRIVLLHDSAHRWGLDLWWDLVDNLNT